MSKTSLEVEEGYAQLRIPFSVFFFMYTHADVDNNK